MVPDSISTLRQFLPQLKDNGAHNSSGHLTFPPVVSYTSRTFFSTSDILHTFLLEGFPSWRSLLGGGCVATNYTSLNRTFCLSQLKLPFCVHRLNFEFFWRVSAYLDRSTSTAIRFRSYTQYILYHGLFPCSLGNARIGIYILRRILLTGRALVID